MSERETAKIYQFALRDRTARIGQRGRQKQSADLASARLAPTDFGSGWYHEAAVQDAAPAPKRQPH